MANIFRSTEDKKFEDDEFWMQLVPGGYSAYLGPHGIVTCDNHSRSDGVMNNFQFTVQAFSKSPYSEGRNYKLRITNMEEKRISFGINTISSDSNNFFFNVKGKDKYGDTNLNFSDSSMLFIPEHGLIQSITYTLDGGKSLFLAVAIVPSKASYFDIRPRSFIICNKGVENPKIIEIPLKYSIFGKKIKWDKGKKIE